MTSDQFLRAVIAKYHISPAAAERAAYKVSPVVKQWADRFLLEMAFSGSFAKGTAVSLSSDVDLFISLSPDTPFTLKDIYFNLDKYLQGASYPTRPQNVSIRVRSEGLDVDLVPGKREDLRTNDHWLYRRKADTRTKTNVKSHVDLVRNCGRNEEIKLIKIWRGLHGVAIPSLYLELAVIDALRGHTLGALASNLVTAFRFFTNDFSKRRFVDPANTANIISDELSSAEKAAIANGAQVVVDAKYWSDVFGRVS